MTQDVDGTPVDVNYALVTFPNGGIDLMKLNWGIIWGAIVGAVTQLAPIAAAGVLGPKAQAIGSAIAILLGAFGVHQGLAAAAPATPVASPTAGK